MAVDYNAFDINWITYPLTVYLKTGFFDFILFYIAMKDYGLVSIITPTWACAPFIGETIRSVLSQSYPHWELLIQDDCSTDNTREIVAAFAQGDARIKYACNPRNVGAAITRNNALRRARGRWIAFLDADDLWLPEKLERQLRFMVERGHAFTYHAYREMNETPGERGVLVSGPCRITHWGMKAFCWPGCLTVMYDVERIGLIQVADIKKNNDYAMWLVVSQKADCYLLDESLALYRRGRDGSVSSHTYWTMIRWHYKLWHEAMEMPLVPSLFWTGLNLCFGLFKKIRYLKR